MELKSIRVCAKRLGHRFESGRAEMLRKTPLKRGTKQLKRSGFARKTGFERKNSVTGKLGGKKRGSSLKRVGTIGKANLKANQIIREYLEMHPIHHCEIMFVGCLGNMFLQVAHKHKRAWYKGDVEKLSDPDEWVCACDFCHNAIEHDKELTDQVFARLRP